MNIKETPLVSVVLCTYNGERFLKKQLNSIIDQTYDHLEIIIVDDCSDDRTLSILEGYQQKDKRIKLFRNERNLGYTGNFEKALKLCNGKYIAFADQDDIWEKEKISILLGEMDGHTMVYHNSDYIDENDKPIGAFTVSKVFRVYEGESSLPFILSNCVHGHATLIDSKLKNYIFPFDKRFSHDWWVTYVAFNLGSVKYIDKVLVHYRQHKNSVTDTFKLHGDKIVEHKKPKGIERISLNLDLLKHCAEFKYNKEALVTKKAYYLLSHLSKGQKKTASFLFLVKYFDLLFPIYLRHQYKSFLSKMNMIRKICFS